MFQTIKNWLFAIDPALPAASLVLLVFATIYSVRRWLPGAWKAIELSIPFLSALDAGPVFNAIWKIAQSLPGMLLGTAVAALTEGANVKAALWGVAAGALASVAHEVMAAYRGQVGGKKPPSAGAPDEPVRMFHVDPPPPPPPLRAALAGLAIALCPFGCSGAPKANACNPADATRLTAEYTAAVHLACQGFTFENCPSRPALEADLNRKLEAACPR